MEANHVGYYFRPHLHDTTLWKEHPVQDARAEFFHISHCFEPFSRCLTSFN